MNGNTSAWAQSCSAHLSKLAATKNWTVSSATSFLKTGQWFGFARKSGSNYATKLKAANTRRFSHSMKITTDANEVVAQVAYQLSEVIAIYPITPSSTMGEWADQWAAENRPNLWGSVPSVTEMQSEGGAAGALHGALQTGSLATTFTASQGLLLMIPNMYKIAGELTPTVMHVAARSLAAQALSIFGDHSDVMACRSAGWAMLGSASVREARASASAPRGATLEARIPSLPFSAASRPPQEIGKIVELSEEEMG